MGAVEHLKTLCCLGLPPESAMIAVTPLLHEIIPHGWTRIMLLKRDATFDGGFGEHPETVPIFRERLWTFAKDPSSPASLTFGPAFRAVGMGWLLHLQGRGWLESRHYRGRQLQFIAERRGIAGCRAGRRKNSKDRGSAEAGATLLAHRGKPPVSLGGVERVWIRVHIS